MLTPHSLYAAVSIGLETATIISVLDRLSKTRLPKEIQWFVRESTENYGKVKLILQRNAFFVESPYPAVLQRLLKDEVIRRARVLPTVQPATTTTANVDGGGGAGVNGGGVATITTSTGAGFMVSRALKDRAVDNLAAVKDIDLTGKDQEEEEDGDGGGGDDVAPMDIDSAVTDAAAAPGGQGTGIETSLSTQQQQQQKSQQQQQALIQQSAYLLDAAAEEDPDREMHAFEIQGSQVEHVKQRCLPGGLNYPMLEEYDFRGDTTNPPLNFELKPHVKVSEKIRLLLVC